MHFYCIFVIFRFWNFFNAETALKLIPYSSVGGGGGGAGGGVTKTLVYTKSDCSTAVLITLLTVLFTVIGSQILLIYYYGSGTYTSTTTPRGSSYPPDVLIGRSSRLYFHGQGALGARWGMQSFTPGPRVNLRALLNRNVPSIAENYKRLRNDLNTAEINRILQSVNNRSSTSGPSRLLPDCDEVPKNLSKITIFKIFLKFE